MTLFAQLTCPNNEVEAGQQQEEFGLRMSAVMHCSRSCTPVPEVMVSGVLFLSAICLGCLRTKQLRLWWWAEPTWCVQSVQVLATNCRWVDGPLIKGRTKSQGVDACCTAYFFSSLLAGLMRTLPLQTSCGCA